MAYKKNTFPKVLFVKYLLLEKCFLYRGHVVKNYPLIPFLFSSASIFASLPRNRL